MILQLPANIQLQIKKMDDTCLHGFLRFTMPEKLVPILTDGYAQAKTAIPFAITAFGDILTWEKNKYICMVSIVRGTTKVLESGSDFFFEDINDRAYAEKYFDLPLYESVRAREGNLEDDECYGCVPLQALGGTASIETFKKVKYREYLELALQVTGKVL